MFNTYNITIIVLIGTEGYLGSLIGLNIDEWVWQVNEKIHRFDYK